MSLLRGLFWAVLFIFFTFCFVVLFEYGIDGFSTGFIKEYEKAKTYVTEKVNPPSKDPQKK